MQLAKLTLDGEEEGGKEDLAEEKKIRTSLPKGEKIISILVLLLLTYTLTRT